MLVDLGWCNAAWDRAHASGKKVVLLNMDETMIAYSFANKRGTVVNPTYWNGINGHVLYDAVGTSATRNDLNLLACIASDPAMQQHLQ